MLHKFFHDFSQVIYDYYPKVSQILGGLDKILHVICSSGKQKNSNQFRSHFYIFPLKHTYELATIMLSLTLQICEYFER